MASPAANVDDSGPGPEPDATVGPGITFNHTKFPYVKTTARINVGDDGDSEPQQSDSDDVGGIYTEDNWQSFSKPHESLQFFDCKFYPYTAPGVDPVFVVTGGAEVCLSTHLKFLFTLQCSFPFIRPLSFGRWSRRLATRSCAGGMMTM